MQEMSNAFTGGDNLTGILSYYSKILMENELNKGYGAYQLTLSTADSGLSFGGNQMDLSEENEARQLFMNIIENAIDNNNQKFFNTQEINSIKLIKIAGKGQSPETVFGKLLTKINAALSSQYGMTKINQEYVKQITDDSIHVENIISNIANDLAKTFYNTTLGKGLLFDYNNQFYLDPQGELKRYMDGNKIITYTGETLFIENSFTLENHKQYMFETKYGIENKADVSRRINNILSILE